MGVCLFRSLMSVPTRYLLDLLVCVGWLVHLFIVLAFFSSVLLINDYTSKVGVWQFLLLFLFL